MRTVILFGLIAIADAINKDWCDSTTVTVGTIIFVVIILMDVWDFILNTVKKLKS